MTDLVQKLVWALERLLDSDPEGAIATASEDDLTMAANDMGADPVIREQAAAVLQARAALSEAKAGGWVAVPVEPVAYRVDWPVEAGVGMRRFYGADEWESARGTVEFFGGLPVPLAPLPAPPAQKEPT